MRFETSRTRFFLTTLLLCALAPIAKAATCEDLKLVSQSIVDQVTEMTFRNLSLSNAEMCKLFRDKDMPKQKWHIEMLEQLKTCPQLSGNGDEMIEREKFALKAYEEYAVEYCTKAGM